VKTRFLFTLSERGLLLKSLAGARVKLIYLLERLSDARKRIQRDISVNRLQRLVPELT